MPVCEMAAVRQVHPEHGVPWLQQREVHGHVRLRAGVRLDVRMLGAEQRPGALDGQRFRHIDELASAVVPLPRIALGVLVGEHRPGSLQHGLAHEVLGGDELQPCVLPVELVPNRPCDIRIRFSERAPACMGDGGSRHGNGLDLQKWGSTSRFTRQDSELTTPSSPEASRSSALIWSRRC